MKRCSRCRETKTVELFNRDRSNADGLFSWCKPCCQLERIARRERDAELRQAAQRRRLYGMEPADFERLVAAHDGVCAVCSRPPSGRPWDRTLHVDHDHETGAIRGLLCGNCNRGIGLLGDDVDTVAAALAYLLGASALRPPTREDRTA